MALKRKKVSIDFDKDVETILDTEKMFRSNASYASMLNEVVRTMYGLDYTVKKVLKDAIERSINHILLEDTTRAPIAQIAMNETISKLNRIYAFLNDGEPLDLYTLATTITVRINLKNAHAIIPSNWIQLDWDNNEESRFVGVIETRNGSKYNIPYFFFTSTKEIQHLLPQERDALLKKCVIAYPLFKEVLSRQVDPIIEKGKIINIKEYQEALEPGFFPVDDDGLKTTYPFGAKIIRHFD